MITLTRPADGPITQLYGATQIDGLPHAGQDYAYTANGQVFDAVYAAADGVVLFAGDSRNLGWPNVMYLNPDFDGPSNGDQSAGLYIIIQHHDGGRAVALTGYGHLDSYTVRAGTVVAAGQRIGTIGETGNSRGKHLHFDFLLYPLNYAAPLYGRVDPNPYFGGLTFSSTAGAIITKLQEAGVALELKDLEQIQGIIQSERETIINEVRAQATWVLTELAQKVADSAYQVKVFNQETFNPRFDQVVGEIREAGK